MLATSPQTSARLPVSPALFGQMRAETLPALRPQVAPQNRMNFTDGQEIFAEGDDAAHVYEIVSGAVRTSKLLSDGRRQIDAFHLAGDIFGIELGAEHRFSADALGDVTLIVRRRVSFTARAGEDPAAARDLLTSTMRMLERAQDHLVLLGRKTAMEKVGSFLLSLMERSNGGDHLELPMSRLDIADHLGLTIETVSRTLMELQRKQAIEFAPCSRAIIVKNKGMLRRMAE
ncbi:cyclic nucleotide-binding domain-containing protein [Phreatobacter aquaticus]|uniref:Cyclic nucleotide-binding domain-containing protein n=1 Tax=Phreatobacter aquaticus TaxID=2570229 RepID=A0A4D7QMZ5_9HYPH|nr:helix-turn-helix domain-containing protein [Phreatobacter aquaticus]QCK86437.1 cyclic nucleotide-binding domain-containing protein [Phreatobacter aquaticus]